MSATHKDIQNKIEEVRDNLIENPVDIRQRHYIERILKILEYLNERISDAKAH